MLTQSDVKSRENGSTMRISFLAPRLPPAVCGVADHTRLLAGAMADQGAQVGFISAHPAMPGESESALGGPIGHWSGGPRSLIQCLAQQGAEWLWVQLSSYGFERKGAPWRLALFVQCGQHHKVAQRRCQACPALTPTQTPAMLCASGRCAG